MSQPQAPSKSRPPPVGAAQAATASTQLCRRFIRARSTTAALFAMLLRLSM
ncbi:hypothetical protein GLE_3725 [Lysobacter enzymogenes]|uniref:Uncharacterized protein n=1 Tax=Lysobacter enzymogenes TaxID=69 RepID=A0A0S2DL62_LYSEN|nr:hypothetical protein GLE_3725 [Lysobacter enzymogenes]